MWRSHEYPTPGLGGFSSCQCCAETAYRWIDQKHNLMILAVSTGWLAPEGSNVGRRRRAAMRAASARIGRRLAAEARGEGLGVAGLGRPVGALDDVDHMASMLGCYGRPAPPAPPVHD